VAINTQKVVVGGLGAGVVLAVLDFLVNGLLLADQGAAAMAALNPDLAASLEGNNGLMVAFVAIDLLLGITIVWTYAAIRPRFGAGPRAALFAGLQVWAISMLLYAAMTAMGMWTWGYFALGALAFLVCALAAAYVGGMLYKEE